MKNSELGTEKELTKSSQMNSTLRLEDVGIVAGGRTLLSNVSAEFQPGELALIVGPSGVGKSLLLRLASGLLDCDGEELECEGRVTIGGQPAETGDIGVVFQSFALFDQLSPTENVQFAKSLARQPLDQSATELLEQLQVPVRVPTSRLSGGQKQRLAIARTLAYNPSVIFFDEPTSGLDPATGKMVARLIKSTNERFHKTSVVVTHDYESLLPVADRVYLLDPVEHRLELVPPEQWSSIPERLEQLTAAIRNDDVDASPESWQLATTRAVLQAFDRTTGALIAFFVGLLRLVPTWNNATWGGRFFAHFVRLVFGPTAIIYLVIAGVISGFVVTYFTFKFLPYGKYTEPLLIEDLLTALGFSIYRIFVPILSCILIAARCGAAITADIGSRQYGNQIDALRTFGAKPDAWLLRPITWSFLIGTPFLTFIAYWTARFTSMVTFLNSHPESGVDFWDYYFHKALRVDQQMFFRGTGWWIAKLLCCAFAIALISYFLGKRPKSSTSDVSRSVTATILWATLVVLIIHFAFAFYEYEGVVAGGR